MNAIATWGGALTDIADHLPAQYGDQYWDADAITAGHETSHGIHAHLRNYEAPASVGIHVRRLLALAIPSTIAQLGAMLLMVVDVLMLGRVSVAALDAASLGRVWALGTMVGAMGLVFGIDPIAAQSWGAGNRRRYEGALGSGIAVALLASLPSTTSWASIRCHWRLIPFFVGNSVLI